MKRLLRLLLHLMIVLGIFLLTLLSIDQVNEVMSFMKDPFTKAMQFVLVLLGFACAGRLIYLDRKDK